MAPSGDNASGAPSRAEVASSRGRACQTRGNAGAALLIGPVKRPSRLARPATEVAAAIIRRKLLPEKELRLAVAGR